MITTPSQRPEASTSSVTEFVISGMTCSHCAGHVREALESVPGVVSAAVELETGRARIHWRTDAAHDREAVKAAVERAGYVATPLSQNVDSQLTIEGMTCSHCAQRVAAALQSVPAVASADV